MKNNKKGFTLAELLIVIAIIAILIAIAIPVFASQLRAARLSTDHANIRSAYAWAQSANLMGQADLNGDGNIDAASEVAGKYGTTPTVTFLRDGTIKSGTATNPYTLMVTAEENECLESAACSSTYLDGVTPEPTSKHEQNKSITIQYLEKTITAGAGGAGGTSEHAWYVIMA